MNDKSREELFRKALESEGGVPVSSGVRLSHVNMAAEMNRSFYVDLSGVPESKRPAVISEIERLVQRAALPLTMDM